jgi:hypothetical protein
MNIIEVQAVNDAVLARANVEGPDRTYTVVFLYSREEYEGHLGQTLSRWTCQMTGATYKDASGNRRKVPSNARHLRHQLFFVPHQIVQADLTRDGYIH